MNSYMTKPYVVGKLYASALPIAHRFFLAAPNSTDEIQLRNNLVSKIQKLGGVVESDPKNTTFTHLITDNITSESLFLRSLAAGKWILHSQYIEDSSAQGFFLNEEPYEYGNQLRLKTLPVVADRYSKLASAAYRSRKRYDSKSMGAFSGMKVLLIDMPPGFNTFFEDILRAGGGEILESKLPLKMCTSAPFATHCLTEFKDGCISKENFDYLQTLKVIILEHKWITDYLLNEYIDYRDYEIHLNIKNEFPEQNAVQNCRIAMQKMNVSNFTVKTEVPSNTRAVEKNNTLDENNELLEDVKAGGHIKLNFEKYVQLICPDCGDRFDTDSEWKHHIHSYHRFFERNNLQFTALHGENRKGWQCNICHVILRCSNSGSLRRHTLSHMRYKSFMCRLCGANLRHRGGLINHLRVLHLKGVEEKLECKICGKGFYSDVQFKLHMRVVHNIEQQTEPENKTASTHATGSSTDCIPFEDIKMENMGEFDNMELTNVDAACPEVGYDGASYVDTTKFMMTQFMETNSEDEQLDDQSNIMMGYGALSFNFPADSALASTANASTEAFMHGAQDQQFNGFVGNSSFNPSENFEFTAVANAFTEATLKAPQNTPTNSAALSTLINAGNKIMKPSDVFDAFTEQSLKSAQNSALKAHPKSALNASINPAFLQIPENSSFAPPVQSLQLDYTAKTPLCSSTSSTSSTDPNSRFSTPGTSTSASPNILEQLNLPYLPQCEIVAINQETAKPRKTASGLARFVNTKQSKPKKGRKRQTYK